MARRLLRIAMLAALASGASSAWAIHVENDHPGLQNPKARFVESARAAESILSGETTSISTSSFTGFNTNGIKRKPFPPGYGRSGYEFEDEVLRAVKPADAAPEAKQTAQPAPSAEPPVEARKP
jgi:hypothetical protein